MGNPVVDALSITITTLQEKISSLEEEVNAYRASDLSKASSIWVVYSPERISTWCSKGECGRLARKVKYAAEGNDELKDAIMGKDELPDGAVIVDVSEPTMQSHPLGLLATFTDEDSAVEFVENWHIKNRMSNDDIITLSICEITIA
tara:strand:+ start:228 stop:668 length:441 start_codon:yes stop_codon:yes gene_type:complete